MPSLEELIRLLGPDHPLVEHWRKLEREKALAVEEAKAWRYAAKFRANTRGVSMTPEDFEAQGRRHQRLALDVALIERIRTPERVQTGRAPRSRRTRPSRTSSRGDPDPSEPEPPLGGGLAEGGV
jgi:hypothetical protein